MSVFISYAHKDTDYKNLFVEKMKLLNRLGGITLWHDNLIKLGRDWEKEITAQLGQADAAILLISNDFLASDFCQEEEVSRLLGKRKSEGMEVYPVVIKPCNWNLVPWLAKMNLYPRGKNNEVVPLSDLPRRKKDEFFVFFIDHVFNGLASKATRDTGEGRALVNPAHRRRFASNLAERYPSDEDGVIRDLFNSYKWLYQRGLDEPASQVVSGFTGELSKHGHKVTDRNHEAVLELLRVGLPVEPVHLKDLSSIEIDSLLSTPGYATILHGIRLTETKDGDAAALQKFNQVIKEQRGLNACALLLYATGQCHRKLGHLKEAIGTLQWAQERVDHWQSEHCGCGPQCSADNLLVEIHRGLGAAYRKEGDADKAREHFELAKSYLSDRVSDTVKADFFFSYGYFIFEQAMLKRRTIDEDQYKSQLQEALEMFGQSHKLSPQWSAPLSRFCIVKKLLGQTDIPCFWKARIAALSEGGAEPRLTAIMCGFAILAHGVTGEGGPAALTSEELYRELEGIFQERVASKGARVCHAFDNSVILDSRDISADPWLVLVDRLLEEAAGWNVKSLSEQQKCLNKFRHAHRVK